MCMSEYCPHAERPPGQAAAAGPLAAQASAGRILQYVLPVQPETPNSVVFQRFRADTELHGLPVVDDGRPVGLMRRHQFIETMARPFNHELFDKKPCTLLMDKSPLVVDRELSLISLSGLLVHAGHQALIDGFIITAEGRYLGMGTGYDLMRELTEIQIVTARHANPLTLLPGNVPINERIEQWLLAGRNFHACYCDLDHFKPFNDVYGYRSGDEVIRLAGRILEQVCHPELDFVGHIGGDDFVLLLQSHDWRERCRTVVESFERQIRPLLFDEHVQAGGFVAQDRRGQEVFHPLLRMSIGAVRAEPGRFASHHELSRAMSEAKSMAKKQPDERVFLERRRAEVRPPAGSLPALLQPVE